MNRQLLGTFMPKKAITLTVDYLNSKFDILNRFVYVYEVEDSYDYIIFYTVDNNKSVNLPDNTIPLHRKKQSNSFYTINALNKLIKRINNGVLDTSYQLDWSLYQDMILTIRNQELQISSIFFEEKIKVR